LKKVLFVTFNLGNGGAERSLVNLLTEFDPAKYEIDLLAFAKEGMFLSQVPDYVNIMDPPEILQNLYGYSQKKNLKYALYWLFKLITSGLSRLYESQWQSWTARRYIRYYSKFVPKLAGKYDTAIAFISRDVMYYVADKVDANKKIVFVHNDYRTAKHPKKYDRPFFEKMDNIVSISEGCVNVLKEEYPDFADKILYLPNITSSKVIRERANAFYPKEFKDDGRFHIVSIGRLTEQKGFDMAIDAVAELVKRKYAVSWLIIGAGELKNALQSQIEKLNVSDSIRLIGSMDNPYPYIKHADLVCQSSRWEGKSMVLDEAKILGVPILATNYPTVRDQIADWEGMVVDLSVQGLVEGIVAMMQNPEHSIRYTKNLAEKDYGNASEVNKYYEIIETDN